MNILVPLAGLAATCLILASVVPQCWAIIHQPDISGISITSATFIALSSFSWAVYLYASGMNMAGTCSSFGAVIWAVIAGRVAVRNHELPSLWTVWYALAIVAAGTLGGLPVLGSVLLADALTSTLPQAWRAGSLTTGLSLSHYLLVPASAACWGFYGLAAGDWALSISSGAKAVVCLFIVTLVLRDRYETHQSSPNSADHQSLVARMRLLPRSW